MRGWAPIWSLARHSPLETRPVASPAPFALLNPLVQHRQTHAPIETRGCCAIWDEGRRHLTMHIGNQVPHPYRTQLAAAAALSESQVTVISPDIGGGFGQKIALYREELTVAALARALQAAGALARGPRREFAGRKPRARGFRAHPRGRRRDGRIPRARTGDHRRFRRLLLLSGELHGARRRHDPHRPLSDRRLRLRHQGRAHQQVRQRADARADGDDKLGDGRHDRGDRARLALDPIEVRRAT